ncbi:hypothetical protein N7486_004483 [Penicillium sp. IBT 16267x]|nr:hypothetical protein N7486_004483 [Penicillium sp. IBT 16267x]
MSHNEIRTHLSADKLWHENGIRSLFGKHCELLLNGLYWLRTVSPTQLKTFHITNLLSYSASAATTTAISKDTLVQMDLAHRHFCHADEPPDL